MRVPADRRSGSSAAERIEDTSDGVEFEYPADRVLYDLYLAHLTRPGIHVDGPFRRNWLKDVVLAAAQIAHVSVWGGSRRLKRTPAPGRSRRHRMHARA